MKLNFQSLDFTASQELTDFIKKTKLQNLNIFMTKLFGVSFASS